MVLKLTSNFLGFVYKKVVSPSQAVNVILSFLDVFAPAASPPKYNAAPSGNVTNAVLFAFETG